METLLEYSTVGRHRVVLLHNRTVLLGLIQHDLTTGELWRAWSTRPDGTEELLGIFEEMSDAEAEIVLAAKRNHR